MKRLVITLCVFAGLGVALFAQRNVPAGFIRVEGGTFMMGSPPWEVDRKDWEVQHQVPVGSFYLGKYEVTQGEYETVRGTNPSYFKGVKLPVERVSWFDAIEYCNKRSAKEGLSPAYTRNGDNVTWNKNATGYRLPTEAEWEYACRAETTTPFNTGDTITTSQANYNGDYSYDYNAKGTNREKTTEVGSFAANGWGLHDMHGNVAEWCWEGSNDPRQLLHALRGGSWRSYAYGIRSAFRGSSPQSSYDMGFRLVRPSPK